jgi:hypothetical protein
VIGSLSRYLSYENRFLRGYISHFLLTMLKVGDAAQIRRICDAHADRGVRVRPIPPVAPSGTLLPMKTFICLRSVLYTIFANRAICLKLFSGI